jgi:hypothetical protein
MTDGPQIGTDIGSDAVQLVTLRANGFEDSLAARGVSSLCERRLVLRDDLGALPLCALEQHAGRLTNRGIAMHYQLAPVAEGESPRLNIAFLQGLQHHWNAFRISIKRIRSLQPHGRGKASPALQEKPSRFLTFNLAKRARSRQLHRLRLGWSHRMFEQTTVRRGVGKRQQCDRIRSEFRVCAAIDRNLRGPARNR